MLDRLRTLYRHWRVQRRRRKLLAAYRRVGRVRHGLGPGISDNMFAYDRVLNEGLAVIVETDDGEHVLQWIWPEEDPVLEQNAMPEEADAT